MHEIDRLFFDKYSIDPGSELFVSGRVADGCNEGLNYDDFELIGLDDEEWPDMD